MQALLDAFAERATADQQADTVVYQIARVSMTS